MTCARSYSWRIIWFSQYCMALRRRRRKATCRSSSTPDSLHAGNTYTALRVRHGTSHFTSRTHGIAVHKVKPCDVAEYKKAAYVSTLSPRPLRPAGLT